MGCWCVKDRQTSPAQYVNTRCCFQVLMTPAAASLHGCQWICLSLNKSPASFGWLFLLTGKCFQEYLCSVIVFQCHQYPTYWRRKWHNNSPEPANSVVKSSKGSDVLMIFVCAVESGIYHWSPHFQWQFFFSITLKWSWQCSSFSFWKILPAELLFLVVFYCSCHFKVFDAIN